MKRVQHIAKTLILLTALLLLAGSRYAYAQENSSSSPYIGSTHLYRIAMGNYNNGVTWQLSNPSPTTINTPQAYITYGKKDLAIDSAWIEITFVSSVFDNGYSGPWTLIYTETNAATGACEAMRSLTITPVSNSFNLVMDASTTGCNSYSDSIFDNTDGVIANIIGNSYVPFTVTMNKNEDFRLKQWSFVATVSISGTGYTLPTVLPSVVVSPSGDPTYGSILFTGTGGSSFTGTVSGISATDNFTSDAVTFNVVIHGSPVEDVMVTLSIVGTALSGTNYTVVTGENNTTDNSQTKTIYGIPNTSVIAVTP